MEISHHRDNYQMTDLLRDLIGFLRCSADYELVDGLLCAMLLLLSDSAAPDHVISKQTSRPTPKPHHPHNQSDLCVHHASLSKSLNPGLKYRACTSQFRIRFSCTDVSCAIIQQRCRVSITTVTPLFHVRRVGTLPI
jgi:hypothetical protein